MINFLKKRLKFCSVRHCLFIEVTCCLLHSSFFLSIQFFEDQQQLELAHNLSKQFNDSSFVDLFHIYRYELYVINKFHGPKPHYLDFKEIFCINESRRKFGPNCQTSNYHFAGYELSKAVTAEYLFAFVATWIPQWS